MAIADVTLPPTAALHLGHAADFVLHRARGFTDLTAFVDALIAALAADGVGLGRLSLTLAAMHPQVAAVGATWRAGQHVELVQRGWDGLTSVAFQQSPVACFYNRTHDVIRRRLCDPACPADFDIVNDLRSQGLTDYLALQLGGDVAKNVTCVSVATHRPGGFTNDELHVLLSLQPLLGVLLEAHVGQRIASSLLTTYLGEDAGRRVLAGQVRRGQGESIPAVISFCDVRDFTGLSNRLPREALLELLDDTFDAVTGAVADHGGEVLKFIGDAVLAIYRAQPGQERASCLAAADGARAVFQRLQHHNVARGTTARPRIDVGVSLHIGDVHYGNIGGPARLDFTVVGPAVNLASRLQGLCGVLQRPVVVSSAFAAHAPEHTTDLGVHHLKGIAQPVQAFAFNPAA
jgi:adenylate cyclase